MPIARDNKKHVKIKQVNQHKITMARTANRVKNVVKKHQQKKSEIS